MTTVSVPKTPAGFSPVPNFPIMPEAGYYSLTAESQGIGLDAQAVIYPEKPGEILYFFDERREAMTAEEAREFVEAVNSWWHKCEAHLQGGSAND